MRKTNKKLVNLMMAGVMAAGVIMAPASTFAAKTCNICGHKFDTYDGIVSSWYNRKDGIPGKRLSETGTGQWTGKIPLIW